MFCHFKKWPYRNAEFSSLNPSYNTTVLSFPLPTPSPSPPPFLPPPPSSISPRVAIRIGRALECVEVSYCFMSHKSGSSHEYASPLPSPEHPGSIRLAPITQQAMRACFLSQNEFKSNFSANQIPAEPRSGVSQWRPLVSRAVTISAKR